MENFEQIPQYRFQTIYFTIRTPIFIRNHRVIFLNLAKIVKFYQCRALNDQKEEVSLWTPKQRGILFSDT